MPKQSMQFTTMNLTKEIPGFAGSKIILLLYFVILYLLS